ncbi:GYD domain-containing protein [Rhizobiales bacterium]|uniref:GYD domain-containing protein n=1 Tax=Hongsoonwoonella zoysiae TaxID=2821844 RepID=UPI001560E4F1|nr:GYD domain-containing protein [Hongsoonwoonella zoysiae]NRG18729.1 GYD domain-containing protein [Hongsoonwoonella zoysiae]
MTLYLYQGAYTPESWAAQLADPQNRVETVGKAVCESVGGKLVGAWLSFGEFDIALIMDVPDNVSMASVGMAVAAGGAMKSGRTTVLMSGEDGVAAMRKASSVTYKPKK